LFVTIAGAIAEAIVADLTPASGRQDHTASPSAGAARSSAALPRVHRIPHPTFVTIAKRPSCEAGRRDSVMVICPTGKTENFFDQDWTGRNRLNRFSKFDFAPQVLGAGFQVGKRLR
jgi:hypothetical protein